MKPEVHIDIVVGILERDNKILMLHRKDKDPMWDKKWEFPGGKIEPGETPEAAMIRECFEETGLSSDSFSFFGIHTHMWNQPHRELHVRIHCFHAHMNGEEVRLEQEKTYGYVWESFEEALSYDCLDANADILTQFCEAKNLGRN